MPELRNTARATVTCGLLLQAGYIGATTVAVGSIQLFAGETSALSALALIFFGGLLAVMSWRRARTVVELDHRVHAVTAPQQVPDLSRPLARVSHHAA